MNKTNPVEKLHEIMHASILSNSDDSDQSKVDDLRDVFERLKKKYLEIITKKGQSRPGKKE